MAWIVKDKKKFGQLVRKNRLQKELTQEELAGLVDTSKNMISRIELGYSGPSEKTLNKLAEVLNFSIKGMSPSNIEGVIMEGMESLDQKLQVLMEEVSAIKKQMSENPLQVNDDESHGRDAQVIRAVSELQNKVVELEQKQQGQSGEVEVDEPLPEEALKEIAERYKGAATETGFFDALFESTKLRKLKTRIFVDSYRFLEEQGVDPQETVGADWGDETKADVMRDAVFEFAQSDGDERDFNKLKKKVLPLVSAELSETDSDDEWGNW
jgi:transcriptional regulator with XRE-family HTH domain